MGLGDGAAHALICGPFAWAGGRGGHSLSQNRITDDGLSSLLEHLPACVQLKELRCVPQETLRNRS